jgi:membrane protein implicated in regulation of membrane protease activity
MESVKLVIMVSNDLVRNGVQMLMLPAPTIEIVQVCSTLFECQRYLRRYPASLLLLDDGLGLFGIFGLAALVLGGWFLYDRAGGASVSPAAIVVTAAIVGVFFAFVVAKVLSVRRTPIAQGPETMIGKTGVALGSGLEPRGIVRVASEEWQARTSRDQTIPPGAAIRVTDIDGLVLTVELADDDHTAAGVTADEGRNR